MNALELADELDDMLKAIGLTDNRVPTMLRQQQAEIEALKAENSHLKYEISSGAWNPVSLTDEELSEIYEKVYIGYAGNDFPVDLGRAILRKAQEK